MKDPHQDPPKIYPDTKGDNTLVFLLLSSDHPFIFQNETIYLSISKTINQ